MTKIGHLDLTPLYRHSIGVDRLFDRIASQLDVANNGNYPPYDIVRVGENCYEIRIAVAGFQLNDINVEFHDGKLIVRGSQNHEQEQIIDYLHHGISNRNFVRTFALAEYVQVKNANLKDGILTLTLEREIPESQKPKSIAITYLN